MLSAVLAAAARCRDLTVRLTADRLAVWNHALGKEGMAS